MRSFKLSGIKVITFLFQFNLENMGDLKMEVWYIKVPRLNMPHLGTILDQYDVLRSQEIEKVN